MKKGFTAPLTYLQGKGIINDFILYAKGAGGNTLILTDSVMKQIIGEKVETACKEAEIEYKFEIIEGGCTKANIEATKAVAKEYGARTIVAIGGGSIIDVARASGSELGCLLIMCPTTASQNAPFTTISVVNDEQGHMVDAIFVPFPPHVVIADTDVIANAPSRFVRAGIGDAMSALIEFQEVSNSACTDPLKMVSNTAKYLNKGLYEILLRDAEDAVISSENKIATESFENIVEAIYFSACAGGVSLSHALYEGFRLIKECDKMMHGEIVAYCSLVQLIVTDRKEQFEECFELYRKIGLPTKLEDLGIKREMKDEEYELIAEAAFKSICMNTWVRDKSAADIKVAIKFVDAYGKAY